MQRGHWYMGIQSTMWPCLSTAYQATSETHLLTLSSLGSFAGVHNNMLWPPVARLFCIVFSESSARGLACRIVHLTGVVLWS